MRNLKKDQSCGVFFSFFLKLGHKPLMKRVFQEINFLEILGNIGDFQKGINEPQSQIQEKSSER